MADTRTVELLKEVLVLEGDGTRVKKVANLAGFAKDTVYAQTDGRANPNIHVIKAAWLVTKDPRLQRLLEPQGWRLVPDHPFESPTGTLVEEIGDVHDAATDLRRSAKEALADGNIDQEEARNLEYLINNAELELAEVRAKLRECQGK